MNDLQKYLSLRGITVRQIAEATGQNYHSVQKTVKGVRIIPHVKTAVARHLGVAEELLWGEEAPTALALLIAQEIDRRAECERARLRSRYLRGNKGKVTPRRRTVNG